MAASKTVTVKLELEKALKKLWESDFARLKAALKEGAGSWDIKYEIVHAITSHSPPLFLAGGFQSETEFFKKCLGESSSGVYRNMRVARIATAEEIETLRPYRIDLAIAYLEAKAGHPLTASTPVDFKKLKLPVRTEHGIVHKLLSELEQADLRAAVAMAAGRNKAVVKTNPIAKAIAGALAKTGVKKARFTLTKTEVTLHVPIAELAKVSKALASFKAPATTAKKQAPVFSGSR